MIWIIPCIVIGISIIILVVLVSRKIPQLRVMNVDSSPKERVKKIKEQIILQKFRRAGGTKMKGVVGIASAAGKGVSKAGRRAVQRLYALEQHYQKVKRTSAEGFHAYDDETIRLRIEEAEALVAKEEMIPAEKIFIDIISHNPKSVDAYEGLGHLYLANSQYEQAKETFLFALRLSPQDASVLVALAEVCLATDDPKTALTHMRKAIQKRSKNPKYLDLFIEIALKTGSGKDAQDGIKRLKEVNPENNKIGDFEERLKALKGQNQQKGDVDTKGSSQTE